MMDFMKKDNQSTLLLNNSSSIISPSKITNISTITTSSSSSQASSISSETSSIADPYSISFLTENQSRYHKLLDDLSIIDNIHDTFGCEPESSLYDKHILDVERHIASKQQVLDIMLQSESSYVQDLYTFHELYALRIQTWLNETTEKDLIAKFRATAARKDLETLFQTLHEFATTHKTFLKNLKERLLLWGPTQLISDILDKLHESLIIYKPFLRCYAEFVMVLDTLYKLPSFVKFVEITLNENKKRRHIKVHDVIHYLHAPLYRLSVYSRSIQQLTEYSDPTHPDYTNLLHVAQKFKSIGSVWQEKVQDCHSHLLVLQAFRTIQESPNHMTIYSRLLLFAQLIKVDLDDVTSTSDVRMYFLYNDSLVFCKKQKEKKGDTGNKLVYKGQLTLRGANVRQLPPPFLAKMVEVKKPLFRIGKKSSDSNSLPGAEAFGFELATSEINIDAISPMFQSFHGVPAGVPIRRKHAIRTRSLNEQKIWFETIRTAIKSANSLPAAQ